MFIKTQPPHQGGIKKTHLGCMYLLTARIRHLDRKINRDFSRPVSISLLEGRKYVFFIGATLRSATRMDKSVASEVFLPSACAAQRPPSCPGRWGHIAAQGDRANNQCLDARTGEYPGLCGRQLSYRQGCALLAHGLTQSGGERGPHLERWREVPD